MAPRVEVYRALKSQSRKYHRWIGWVAGVVMAVWVISGVVLMLPGLDPFVPRSEAERPRVSSVTLSPAQAIAAAGATPDANLAIKPLGGVMVYQVFLGSGRSALIDGVTGAVVTITAAKAESLAFGPAGATGRPATLIEKHGGDYVDGTLPVWRFDAGPQGEPLFVSTRDGGVQRTSRGMRVRRYIASWHTFEPIRRIVGERPNEWLLMGLSALAIAMVVTGYLLNLPSRSRADR